MASDHVNDSIPFADSDSEGLDFGADYSPNLNLDDIDGNSVSQYDTTQPPDQPKENNPSQEIATLTSELDALCSQANSELQRLPRPTRIKLTTQTRAIFKSYEQHGSQQRLAHALEKFLLAPDEGVDFSPQTLIPRQRRPETSRNNDLESGPLVRESPFHAVDTFFEISGVVAMPDFLLPALDRIFGLYAADARALLKHHCEKYGDEPIFRAGIREYLQSQVKGVLEAAQNDALTMSPDNRAFLRAEFECTPRKLNLAEVRMLARATRIGIDTIEMFWDDMNVKRRAYFGMRQFVAARELEALRDDKVEAEAKKAWKMEVEKAKKERQNRPYISDCLGGRRRGGAAPTAGSG